MSTVKRTYKNRVPVIDKAKVLDEINENKGKFFSCEFIKKDGTVRKMHGRTGVTKYLRGGTNKVQKKSNSLLTVWDRREEDYRTLNIGSMSKLTIRGTSYKVQ